MSNVGQAPDVEHVTKQDLDDLKEAILKALSDKVPKTVAPVDTRVRKKAIDEIFNVPDHEETVADWESYFDSAGAMCYVVCKLYNNHVLPPHSQTLNYSVLKQLITKVAMQSSKNVSDFYAGYVDDGDQTTLGGGRDINIVADHEIRQCKMNIQEFVDRTVDFETFLEVESLTGNFTAAYQSACNDICLRIGVPQNWFLGNRSPLGDYLEDVKLCASKKPGFQTLEDKLCNILANNADIRGNLKFKKQDNSNEDSTKELLADPKNWYSRFIHQMDVCFENEPTEIGECIDKELQEPTKQSTAPEVVQFFKFKFKSVAGTEDSRITLLDIAILGGLHPRTFAIINNIDYQPKSDYFFQQAKHFFQDQFLLQSSFSKNSDIGFILFNIAIASEIQHDTYLQFIKDMDKTGSEPQVISYFGAKQKQNNEEVSGTKRNYASMEYVANKNQVFAGGVRALQIYFIECLERGAAIYFRVMNCFLEDRLKHIRELEKPEQYLSLFAKLMAAMVNKAEINNPHLRRYSSVLTSDKRQNAYLINETLIQFADLCNLPRHMS